jgi:hypothetical protein
MPEQVYFIMTSRLAVAASVQFLPHVVFSSEMQWLFIPLQSL